MAKTKSRSQTSRFSTRQPRNTTEPTQYEVEVIVAAVPIPRSNGERYLYRIQWYGYPGEDTYEPYQNVKNLDRLLMSFWREIGPIDPRNKEELRPSREWIDSEIRYFRETYKAEIVHSQPLTVLNERTGQMIHYYNSHRPC
ncbi:hypothetical protein PNOK_0184100 [Pyrrhoderma noxium]|uniref:Chromo domain-containing protein n=1 Tax=Pyrrhoderma noxium TaxID=2282107 RepID=A0A286UQT0_9AGAM|nr:hypothetical protein PNOK_0184100 [Pyrrhoderma noxium]